MPSTAFREDVIPAHFACKQKLRRPAQEKYLNCVCLFSYVSETLSLFCHEITPVKVSRHQVHLCDLAL